MSNDLISAFRSLARARRFTASALLMLTLAVALIVAALALGQKDLFGTRALRDPAALVLIDQARQVATRQPLSFQRFARYRSTARTLAGLAGAETDSVNLTLTDDPVGVSIGRVTVNYFSLLGVRLALGRSFAAEEAEPGRDRVVVLAHGTWQGQFNGERSVLGRTILLNDAAYVVVGVLPADFRGPGGGSLALYVPREWPKESLAPENLDRGLSTVGRVAAGSNLEQVRAELATIQPEAGSVFAAHYATVRSSIISLAEARSNTVPVFQRMLFSYRVIMGATVALFVIALVNVSGLFLLRAVARGHEVGIRTALGASPRALFVRFGWEGLLLGGAGSALGWLAARWLLVLLGKAAPSISVGEVPGFGTAALAVAAALPLVMAGISGGLPLLVRNRRDPSGGLKEGGARFSAGKTVARLRAAIVVVEVGLASILLVGAGLLIRTTWRLAAVEVGFDPAAKAYVTLTEPRLSGKKTDAERWQIRQRIAAAVAAVPGVERVALASTVIPGSLDRLQPFTLPARPEITDATADVVAVSPEYFAALGLGLKSGRPFEPGTRLGAPFAVINETMARRYFPDQDPLGQRIQFGRRDQLEIIGIVADARSLREPAVPRFYRPVSELNLGRLDLLVGMPGRPTADLGARLRRAIYEAEPTYVVRTVRALTDAIEGQMGNERSVLGVLGGLAAGAVVLCMAGVFTNMAYAVAQRRTEFGVRLALGATPGAIYRAVFRQGLAIVAVGTLLGLLGAGWLGALIRSLLYETAPVDAAVDGATALGMLGVALLALWLPARTAARTEIAGLLKADC